MQINKQTILDAACDILSEFGLADLTMRRLARNLDVVAGALYWHFPSKQALLGGIADMLIAPISATSATDYCEELFAKLTSLRDGAEITLAAHASGTLDRNIVADLEDTAPGLGLILFHYIFGAALDVQAQQSVALATDGAEPSTPDIGHGVRLILGVA